MKPDPPVLAEPGHAINVQKHNTTINPQHTFDRHHPMIKQEIVMMIAQYLETEVGARPTAGSGPLLCGHRPSATRCN
jgi:hypothetical protein